MIKALCRRILLASPVLCLLSCPAFAAAGVVRFERTEVAAAARALVVGNELRLEAVPWPVDGRIRSERVTLERFEVFEPGAK
ncbi:MAG: hypothetical protein ABIU84_11070, partial [Thermoanaerobaculia bacterium]